MSTQSPEPADTRSLGQLVSALAEQSARLVRTEIELAKAELAGRAKELGTGAGLFGAAGVLAFFGFGTLLATAIIALSLVLPAWAAALIVTGGLFLIAGILALVGRAKVSKSTPGRPAAAMDSIKGDVEAVKKGIQS